MIFVLSAKSEREMIVEAIYELEKPEGKSL